MNNIVPESVNDRMGVLFKQINNATSAISNLSKNYISDLSDNSLVIKGSTFTINTENSAIFLGNKTNPDSMILYGTGDTSTITQENVPNGSLYLTNDNIGEAYLKVNDI